MKVDKLSGLLQVAQEFIFRVQHYQQKITETVATAEYTALFESVQSWVEFRLGDNIYDRSMLKDSPRPPGRATKFLKLVSPAGKNQFSYSDTDQPDIVAAVMQFLMEEDFEKDSHCSIEPGDRIPQHSRAEHEDSSTTSRLVIVHSNL